MTATKQKAETPPMNYDLHSVGFSTAGSILVLRMPPPTKDRTEGLYLQTVPNQDFMRVSVLRGDQPVEYDHVAGPASLVLKPKTGSGKVEFVFESPAILRARTTGVSLRLEMPSGQVLLRQVRRRRFAHDRLPDVSSVQRHIFLSGFGEQCRRSASNQPTEHGLFHLLTIQALG